MSKARINIIGAGLAGCEAAFHLAEHGVDVVLWEMRPKTKTEAHQSDGFAELVCSNSLKSLNLKSAHGMLKAEMEIAGSLVLRVAHQTAVPAGEALAVDRDAFSREMTRTLRSHPRVECVTAEVATPPAGEMSILATGPLTSSGLGEWLQRQAGEQNLYFYDAIAPIVEAGTIDLSRSFVADRYDKGGDEAAYINCPLDEAEYYAFIQELLAGECVVPRAFEKEKFYQGCQPIEAIAATGKDSLRFGPMKPVGLADPGSGRRPFAVVQLRPENVARTAFNLVGFQTKLKYGEQDRVFRLIPALKSAKFLRYGSVHRNSFLCAPRVLRPDLSLKGHPLVYVAGQLTGVEGYLESAACGLMAGVFVRRRLLGRGHLSPPADSAIGALLRHLFASDPERFQPSGMHFGLFDIGGAIDREKIAAGAAREFSRWWEVLHG